MKVANDKWPPNLAEIVAVLPQAARTRGVLFCFGDTIYNPHSVPIHESIMGHEQVHSVRQGTDPVGWWRRYLSDPQFRFEEELLAHQVEYLYWHNTGNRLVRRRNLSLIADRLSGALYGKVVSKAEAKKLILQVVDEIEEARKAERDEALRAT